jgi:hypothetical protein
MTQTTDLIASIRGHLDRIENHIDTSPDYIEPASPSRTTTTVTPNPLSSPLTFHQTLVANPSLNNISTDPVVSALKAAQLALTHAHEQLKARETRLRAKQKIKTETTGQGLTMFEGQGVEDFLRTKLPGPREPPRVWERTPYRESSPEPEPEAVVHAMQPYVPPALRPRGSAVVAAESGSSSSAAGSGPRSALDADQSRRGSGGLPPPSPARARSRSGG